MKCCKKPAAHREHVLASTCVRAGWGELTKRCAAWGTETSAQVQAESKNAYKRNRNRKQATKKEEEEMEIGAHINSNMLLS